MHVNQFGETLFLYLKQVLCYESEIATIPQTMLQLKRVLCRSNHLSCGFYLLWHSRQTLFAIFAQPFRLARLAYAINNRFLLHCVTMVPFQ